MNPPLGTFIRPAGRCYAYCYELVKVVPIEKVGHFHQWHLKRWGMKNRQPFDDGHHDIHYMRGLLEVLPGAWKYPPEFNTWDLEPLYYRRIDTRGQISLF